MKKFVFVTMVTLALALFMSACTTGSYSSVRSVEVNQKNHWSMSYEKFNGYKQRKITLNGKGEHKFTVEITTESGTLGLLICKNDGTAIYEETELGTSVFEVVAEGGETYSIRLDAVTHAGSFDIKW